jgi:SAM-dependent methyltransferase
VKNEATWQPSKYVVRRGRLVGSRDLREVGLGSRLMVDLIARQYERLLPLHAQGRLLDLGCGKVPLYASYRALVTSCVCVDWANTAHKNEHLDQECDLTRPLPFANAEFDTIILSDVLEHIPTPEALCQEMARSLRAQGKLIMNVPFFYWLHEEPHDFYRYTEFALRRFVESAGLVLVLLEPIGGAPEVMADIFAKHVLHVPLVGRAIASFTQWLTLRFVGSSLGRKLSRKSARKFPFGYVLVAQKA